MYVFIYLFIYSFIYYFTMSRCYSYVLRIETSDKEKQKDHK